MDKWESSGSKYAESYQFLNPVEPRFYGWQLVLNLYPLRFYKCSLFSSETFIETIASYVVEDILKSLDG
mgnify:CR=1 FL=1